MDQATQTDYGIEAVLQATVCRQPKMFQKCQTQVIYLMPWFNAPYRLRMRFALVGLTTTISSPACQHCPSIDSCDLEFWELSFPDNISG